MTPRMLVHTHLHRMADSAGQIPTLTLTPAARVLTCSYGGMWNPSHRNESNCMSRVSVCQAPSGRHLYRFSMSRWSRRLYTLKDSFFMEQTFSKRSNGSSPPFLTLICMLMSMASLNKLDDGDPNPCLYGLAPDSPTHAALVTRCRGGRLTPLHGHPQPTSWIFP